MVLSNCSPKRKWFKRKSRPSGIGSTSEPSGAPVGDSGTVWCAALKKLCMILTASAQAHAHSWIESGVLSNAFILSKVGLRSKCHISFIKSLQALYRPDSAIKHGELYFMQGKKIRPVGGRPKVASDLMWCYHNGSVGCTSVWLLISYAVGIIQ